jgi:hypothetical protein
MKHTTTHNALFVLLALVLSLNGCIKDEDLNFDKVTTGEWNPEFAVPLIQSKLSIKDITDMNEDGMFSVNNNQVSLVYDANIYSIYGYEFFPPVNQSDFQSIQFTGADSLALYLLDTLTITQNRVISLSFPNNEQIDSLNFNSGQLRIELNSTIPHDGTLNITIPSATLNGVPFSKSIPLSAATTNPVFVQDLSDMSGYNMGTKNAGMPNMLMVNLSVTFIKTDTISNSLNKSLDITTAFDSIAPESLFGFFGQREFIMGDDSTQISIFNNFQGGSIQVDNPKMTISLYNSFGMPLDAQINTLSAILENGTVMPLTGPIPSPLIDFPLSFGQTASNSFTFDKNNSNIKQVINSAPKYFVYNIGAGTNAPLPTYNFMSEMSSFRADMKIEIPLKGHISGFTIQDTVDFSIGDIEQIASATFRINISNGFPIHAYTQLYFTDENYNILDSMFTYSQDRIVEAAPVDANGVVTAPMIRSADEEFEGIRLQHLLAAKKILIKGVLSTTDAPNTMVSIYDNYILDFKLGVRTKLKIEF